MPTFDAHEHWDGTHQQKWGLHGVGYAGLGRQFNGWMYRVRRHVFRRVAQALPVSPETARVLDVGSGTGFYIRQWQDVGARRVEGADFADTAVARLRATLPGVPIHQLDIGGELPPELVGQFDLVSAFDVLFHIVDDARYEAAFANTFRLLRPGGVFIFSDNFVRHGTVRGTEQVSHSRETIERAVHRAGYSIQSRAPMFVVMNFPVDTPRRLPKLAWKAMTRPARHSDAYGYVLGLVLYPIELALLAMRRESPTTEVMVCRKPG